MKKKYAGKQPAKKPKGSNKKSLMIKGY